MPLKIREDQCVQVLCYVNGCLSKYHRLLDVLGSWEYSLSIFDTRHQSVQLFFSVSEGSFQYCKLGILFKRNRVERDKNKTKNSLPIV